MYDKQLVALQQVKKYEVIIKQFVQDERGVSLIYTDDAIAAKILRNTFSSHLQLKGDCLRFAMRENEMLKEARRIIELRGKILFFIERVVDNRSNNQLIKFLKTTYPEASIILMTTETDRNLLVYLHEIGADNFIVKPVSVNTLIEKIALTIRPQGQLPKLVGLGKELVQNGEYQKALETADKLLEIKPNSSAALMIQGDAYLRMGRDEEALQSYLEAAEYAKMYLEPLKKIVEFFRQKQDVSSQLAYLEKLERLSPMNMDRKIEIGELHLDQGNLDTAQDYFQEAVKISTKQARDMIDQVKLTVAEACLKKDAGMAERYFREILDGKSSLSQSDVHVFNRLGIALRKQGKWEQAVKEFKKVLNVANDTEVIHYNIGMAYMEGGRYWDAHDAFEKAMKINQAGILGNDVTTYNIGVVMQQLNKRDKALAMFQRVKELKPDFPGIDKRISDVS
ncbi:tetratricopeptide repeat protein [Desulfonatronum parangueonense]